MLRYLHLDVFTDRPFTGNQLAVFPEPGALTTDEMQAIAREMAFSESTFIYPAESGGDVKMRIFTPGEELPIAGHPTVGSTFALAIERVIDPGRKQFVFELGVGPTPVSLEWTDGGLSFVWMTQPNPVFGARISDREALAAAMGVAASDLVPDLPPQVVSCGVPFLVVPMVSRGAVDRVRLDGRGIAQCLRGAGEVERPVFFFTLDGRTAHESAYSRMIAPGFGIAEDPATGSASGPLGAYLLHHRAVTPDEARTLVSVQGVAMGRPSRIHISIEGTPEQITRVRVGGTSVLVGHGELRESAVR